MTADTSLVSPRPAPDEYASAYVAYVARIRDDEDVVAVLASQIDEFVGRLERISEARGEFRYAPQKWSIKEVVGHLSDTERVFSYRALRIGRGDTTPLPSFDDQAYVAELRAADRTLVDLRSEWGDVRRATVALFRSFSPIAWSRRGVANGQPISVRALAYVVAGHLDHHVEGLEARYGVGRASGGNPSDGPRRR